MKKISCYALFVCLLGCSKLEPYINPHKPPPGNCNIKEQITRFAEHPEVAFAYFNGRDYGLDTPPFMQEYQN